MRKQRTLLSLYPLTASFPRIAASLLARLAAAWSTKPELHTGRIALFTARMSRLATALVLCFLGISFCQVGRIHAQFRK